VDASGGRKNLWTASRCGDWEFEVDTQTAARDLEEFLEQLDQNQYLLKMEDNDEKQAY
jgi:hypothetical protein